MSYLEIIFLAIALSIDAMAVSFSYGLSFRENRVKNALLLAVFTGFFQAVMPVIGYYLTSCVKSYIAPFASLIVCVIFIFLGVKFIKEAFQKKEMPQCISLACLFLIGIATSIDAFSAGISLALYGNKIFKPVLLIGLITFFNSCLGFKLGGKLKHLPTTALEVLSGVVLILFGIKAVL